MLSRLRYYNGHNVLLGSLCSLNCESFMQCLRSSNSEHILFCLIQLRKLCDTLLIHDLKSKALGSCPASGALWSLPRLCPEERSGNNPTLNRYQIFSVSYASLKEHSNSLLEPWLNRSVSQKLQLASITTTSMRSSRVED